MIRWMLGVLTSASVISTVCVTQGNNLTNQSSVITVLGAAGEGEFGEEFGKWAEVWSKAAGQGGANHIVVGRGATNAETDLSRLKQTILSEPTNAMAELWLVLIGHGTFDGREAKFNLRGPDLSATELADWLKPLRRPVIVINCASSSSPFVNKLSGLNRVIVTATRSGYEQNFARFGKYMAEAINDARADLDKDGQTSVLEAFIMASRSVAEFYDAEGRLSTEHALIDDNGDGLGTSADFFRGVRAVKKPASGGLVDGLRAHQIHLVRSAQELAMPPEVRVRRDELELAIARLRESKKDLDDVEYYKRLERLLLEISRLYASPDKP
jgi:hypothetical protein